MKLQNLALIDLEKLNARIEELKEIDFDSPEGDIQWIELVELKNIRKELIPAKKLAELSFEAGRQAHLESHYQYSSKTYETEKEEFLNSEIDLT